jgi:hypothetical protein
VKIRVAWLVSLALLIVTILLPVVKHPSGAKTNLGDLYEIQRKEGLTESFTGWAQRLLCIKVGGIPTYQEDTGEGSVRKLPSLFVVPNCTWPDKVK